MLLSSHYYEETTIPSPHVALQVLEEESTVKPVEQVEQRMVVEGRVQVWQSGTIEQSGRQVSLVSEVRAEQRVQAVADVQLRQCC